MASPPRKAPVMLRQAQLSRQVTRLLISLASLVSLAALAPALSADLRPRPNSLPPPPPPAVALTPWAAPGFYFVGRQMLGVTDNTAFQSGAGASLFDTRYEFGRHTGAAVGYAFAAFGAFRPRVELEGSFGTLSVDRHTVTNGGVTQAADKADSFGDLRSTTGLFNAFVDGNLGAIAGARADSMLWRITPFVGAGVGATQATLRRQGVSATGVVMDGSDTRMTWQVSAGVGYQILDRTTVEVGYRHQRTEGLTFTARDGTQSRADLVNNLVTIGVRRQF